MKGASAPVVSLLCPLSLPFSGQDYAPWLQGWESAQPSMLRVPLGGGDPLMENSTPTWDPSDLVGCPSRAGIPTCPSADSRPLLSWWEASERLRALKSPLPTWVKLLSSLQTHFWAAISGTGLNLILKHKEMLNLSLKCGMTSFTNCQIEKSGLKTVP
jgi:hypothetical protein